MTTHLDSNTFVSIIVNKSIVHRREVIQWQPQSTGNSCLMFFSVWDLFCARAVCISEGGDWDHKAYKCYILCSYQWRWRHAQYIASDHWKYNNITKLYYIDKYANLQDVSAERIPWIRCTSAVLTSYRLSNELPPSWTLKSCFLYRHLNQSLKIFD